MEIKGLSLNKIRNLDILYIGTTCADMYNPKFKFLNKIAIEGVLVNSKKMVPVKKDWLDCNENSYVMGGGTLNLGPLAAKAGRTVGILTSFGKGDFNDNLDNHGQFMYDLMLITGVFPIIVINEKKPSSASFIRPAQDLIGKREAILHCPNAVDDLDLENWEIMNALTQLKDGAIVHYLYSSLAKIMDSENGRKLGRVMKSLREKNYITTVDPHTLSNDPERSIREKECIEGYKLLIPVLPHLSWFFASQDEAMMIANTIGYPIQSKTQSGKNNEFLVELARYTFKENTPRIFGATAGTSVHLIYIDPDGNSVGPVAVESPYIITEADKFIGAGDSFRAGFEVEWTKNGLYLELFNNGGIKIKHLKNLALSGHLMAACYVTRNPLNQYGNIPKYNAMQYVLSSNKSFTKKEDLIQTLQILS